MTTWAQRHPWFNPPTMKRRQSTSDDDDDDDDGFSFSSDALPSSSRRKRVRYTSLEHTLAHMTLGSAVEGPKTSPPRLRMNVIFPGSVKEPGTPASEPVEMDVEPTVVTTDTFDQQRIQSGQLDIKEVQISSAVLECIKRQTKCPPPLIPLSCQTTQALVLYRALRPPSLAQTCDEPEEKSSRTSILVAQEDVVMEDEHSN